MKISHLLPAAIAAALLVVAPVSAAPDKDNNGHGKPDKVNGKPDKAKSAARKPERFDAGGPPPWAPAHGYRRGTASGTSMASGGSSGSVSVKNDEVKISAEIGKGTCNRDTIGAVLGGVVGGAIGNQAAGKEDREAATIAGVVIGGIVGYTIGKQMDKRDVQCTGQVLERAADRKTVTWRNPESGQNYEVTPLSTFTQDGQFCREYLARALDGSARKESMQSACRTPDGNWRMVQ